MSKRIHRIKQKLNKNIGFTLAEMLITTLILLMVSMILATGVPTAINAYNKVVMASNAQVLLSTTISALRNELATSRNISIDKTERKAIVYYDTRTKMESKIDLAPDGKYSETINRKKGEIPEGTIMRWQYVKLDGSPFDDNSGTRLVSAEASTKGLFSTYDSIDGSNLTTKGYIIIKGLTVKNETTKKEVTEKMDLNIRIIGNNP